MKKFISAVTALAMTATMVSVAPAAVNAASATKTLSIKAYDKAADSTYAASGDTVTISKDAIAKGSVTVPLALYLTEDAFNTETISAPITVTSSSKDVAKVKFAAHSSGRS